MKGQAVLQKNFSYSHPSDSQWVHWFCATHRPSHTPTSLCSLSLCHIFSPATCSREIFLKEKKWKREKEWEILQCLIMKYFCVSTFHWLLRMWNNYQHWDGTAFIISSANKILGWNSDSSTLINIIDYTREFNWTFFFFFNGSIPFLF